MYVCSTIRNTSNPAWLIIYSSKSIICAVRFCLRRFCCTLRILHALQQDLTNILSNLIAFVLIHVRRRDCATSRAVDRDNVDEHKATSRVVWTIAECKDKKKKKKYFSKEELVVVETYSLSRRYKKTNTGKQPRKSKKVDSRCNRQEPKKQENKRNKRTTEQEKKRNLPPVIREITSVGMHRSQTIVVVPEDFAQICPSTSTKKSKDSLINK